jgi:hypothetical protein
MDDRQFTTLHRHWIWSNVMKKSFDAELPNWPREGRNVINSLAEPGGTYMCLWYGLPFSVLDVLIKNRVSIPEIDADIRDIFRPLKLFRNAVFHPQKRY